MHIQKNAKSSSAFTLIELLVVVAIIGLLVSAVFASLQDARQSAYEARAKVESASFRQALEMYVQDNGDYPADVSRGIPAGLEEYLEVDDWPEAPWPGSQFDWDNWDIDGTQVLQISIRFCEVGRPSTCRFPAKDWADDFEVNSAAYWCIDGPCRAHSGEPVSYPAHCLNCGN